MIWAEGRIIADDVLKVSALDRTFEHGLGLFETLRTWNGRAPLLDRHLSRMARSARALGVPIDSVRLPDADEVAELVEASRLGGNVLLRITLTGGRSESGGAVLWVRAAPLPPPTRRGGARVTVGDWVVNAGDPMTRHKTLNYWSRRIAHESARRCGFDEVLSLGSHLGPDGTVLGAGGTVWEGNRTNLFAVKNRSLFTPTTKGPIVPGVMRQLVLDRAVDLAFETVGDGGSLTLRHLRAADEVFLTNSVRGLIPVARVMATGSLGGWVADWEAPGPWTQRLSILVYDWLRGGGQPS
jgi:branched-subunit amino acid aminotransferase/4-amino-4-deoxychorismate lyase